MKKYKERSAGTSAVKVYRLNRAVTVIASTVVLALAIVGVWGYHSACAAELPASAKKTLQSGLAQQMQQLGLVNVQQLDSTIQVHLFYATTNNFTGKVLYADLQEAYLQKEVAAKLLKAQQRLKALHPEYSLIVYDAARPMAVQKRMWNLVAGTNDQNYVANPNTGGGLHNYGAAVDLSIVDAQGKALDMGTHYDFFGKEAHTDQEQQLLAAGKLTQAQLENRLLLRKVMTEAGFRVISTEWWHFNSVPLVEARKLYRLIE